MRIDSTVNTNVEQVDTVRELLEVNSSVQETDVVSRMIMMILIWRIALIRNVTPANIVRPGMMITITLARRDVVRRRDQPL